MILLTDTEGNSPPPFKSVSQAAYFVGRSDTSIRRSLDLGYFVTHRTTKIKYKACYSEK